MPTKPKVTLAVLQDMLTQFMSQTRMDVSTIAGAVKELTLELRAERRDREEAIERLEKQWQHFTECKIESLAGLAKDGNGCVGEACGLPGPMVRSLQQAYAPRVPESD